MNRESRVRHSGSSALKALVLVSLVAAAVLMLTGCSGKGVDVNVNSSEKSRFGPGDDWEATKESRLESSERRRARSPFLTLSAYDWEYTAWLQAVSDVTRALQLPDSADAYVTLTFQPGQDTPEPAVQITCEQPEAECRRLVEQLEALEGYPPLPEDFPHPELQVVISRVPR